MDKYAVWVKANEMDLSKKTGVHNGKLKGNEKCLVTVQGGKVVRINFSNGAQMSDEFRDMTKLDLYILDESPVEVDTDEVVGTFYFDHDKQEETYVPNPNLGKPLQAQEVDRGVEKAAEQEMNEFFKWWRKEGYHFDGINFDDNPGHDDYQTFTPGQLYSIYTESLKLKT